MGQVASEPGVRTAAEDAAARDADLAQVMAGMTGPNPHEHELGLPPSLLKDDGAGGDGYGAGYGGEQGLR